MKVTSSISSEGFTGMNEELFDIKNDECGSMTDDGS